MKYCKDCLHFYIPPNHTPESALCTLKKGSTSLVTGEVVYPHMFCSAMRVEPCGKDAKFYEPKEEHNHV